MKFSIALFHGKCKHNKMYRIVGKFGEDLNLSIWRVVWSSSNLIPRQIFRHLIHPSPSPSKRLECLGPRLCHSWGSWEGGSRLRLGNHGRCSSCSRESLWQCRGATRQQCWALHPPQTLFTFNYGADTAVPLALPTSNFYYYLFINIIYFVHILLCYILSYLLIKHSHLIVMRVFSY